MAKHLDLEEQEQLDNLKHFWKRFGNLITWLLIVVFGAFAAWNGYQYWQRSQGAQASQMFDEVERAVQSGDMPRIDRAFGDMKDRYGKTLQAQQAGLLVAKAYVEKGNIDAAQAALTGVAEKAGDEAYRAIARLRLAGLLIDKKVYDEALKQLAGDFPKDFAALANDRRGDVLLAQGKKVEAKAEYEQAYKGMGDRVEYRRLVEVKLNSLGSDMSATSPVAAASPN
jgi:predicted negative regulator of RcsB-dependent stress response